MAAVPPSRKASVAPQPEQPPPAQEGQQTAVTQERQPPPPLPPPPQQGPQGQPEVTVVETPVGTMTTTVEGKQAEAEPQPTPTRTSTDSPSPPSKAPTFQPPSKQPTTVAKAPTFQPPSKQPTTVVTGDIPPQPIRATVESGSGTSSVSSLPTPQPATPKKAKTVQQPDPPLVTVNLDEGIAPHTAVRVQHTGASSSDWEAPPAVRVSADPEKGRKKQHHHHSKPAHQHGHEKHYGDEGEPWNSSILGCFDNCGDCLIGYCCPCILYGKTDHRMKRSPTLEGYSMLNTPCLISCLVTTCICCWGNGIVSALQRRDVRRRYNLKGDTLTDVAYGCLLPCCALIQNENEVRKQEGVGKEEQYSQRGAVMRYDTSSSS